MQTIIYDPQQKNMDFMFEGYDAGVSTDDFWHNLQALFQRIGFKLCTPATYSGRLEDVAWVIFQNMPSEIKPSGIRRKTKNLLRSLTSKRTFYQKCMKAGLEKKTAVILYEPEVVAEFSYNKKLHKKFPVIFTWDEELIKLQKQYKPFVYPQPYHKPLTDMIPFEQRKLICNFSANKKSSHKNELYSARIRTIRYLENNCLEEFDHYGRGWSNDFKSWRGPVDDKNSVMAGYKFNLCYENAQNSRGYVTEKIFDALLSGCVPIYLGSPDIEDRIPPSAFIDRRKFGSDDELLNFLRSVDAEQWKTYVDSGQSFLQSQAYQEYTPEGIFNLLRKGLSLNA